MIRTLAASLSCVFLLSCGGEEAPPMTPASGSLSFADQANLGQRLYTENCAKCHGGQGEGKTLTSGMRAPPLVGVPQGALPLAPPPAAKFRKNEFRTVADVADFVVHNMPPDNPGSLSSDEYWAILAFDLKANGIDLGQRKLDATVAPTLTIPR
jgi:cytochrome c